MGCARDALIGQHCTEFEQVTDEQFELIKRAFSSRDGYVIIEKIPNMKKLIQNTVADYVAQEKARQEEYERMEAERLRLKEERAAKRLAKKEDKRKQLEQLAKELGVKVVQQ
jgi:predicted O-linked N-acetylglucosamine transferase (SPINDLY family)